MVKLFSATYCAPCKQLKSYLKQKNISYTEKIVDQEPEASEELIALTGRHIVPTLQTPKGVTTGMNIGTIKSLLDIT